MKEKSSRSSIFLMELIVAILCFALASALCLRFFVQSKNVSTDAVNLNNAVFATSSVCEIFDASDSIDDAIAKLSFVYADQDFNYSESDKFGSLQVSLEEALMLKFMVGDKAENGTISISIRVVDEDSDFDTKELTTGAIPEHVVYELNKEVYYGQ